MRTAALLSAHAYLAVHTAPGLWNIDARDVEVIPLLLELIAVALRPGRPLHELRLAAVNVVVPAESADEDAVHSLGPGEYVAMTVTGPGTWSADWV